MHASANRLCPFFGEVLSSCWMTTSPARNSPNNERYSASFKSIKVKIQAIKLKSSVNRRRICVPGFYTICFSPLLDG